MSLLLLLRATTAAPVLTPVLTPEGRTMLVVAGGRTISIPHSSRAMLVVEAASRTISIPQSSRTMLVAEASRTITE